MFTYAQVCFILYEYKDCKTVLKRDGWEVSQYQKMLKENAEQFDLMAGGGGSMSRDSHGSKRRKKGKKLSSRKSKKKDKDCHDNETEGGVRVEEQQQRPQVRVHSHTVFMTFSCRVYMLLLCHHMYSV